MMIRQQDQTIDSIAGTLSTLAEQAGLMGREIVEHNECVPTFCMLDDLCSDFYRMLDDIDRTVDKTDSKLNDAMRKMKKFIRQTEGTSLPSCPPSPSPLTPTSTDTKSGYCIIILIIVLMALLLAVILI